MKARFDVAIIGAGPAGLACACLASAAGLRVALIEKQPEEVLAAPPPDGRDIALTHRSVQCLQEICTWKAIPADEISPINRARVRNGASARLLSFEPQGMGREALGFLVGNDIIRRHLYRSAKEAGGIELIAATSVTEMELGAAKAMLTLSSGGAIETSLVVAADSRFSQFRQKAGIGAEMKDFGRVCIVCRMSHETAHDGTAEEWFDTDQTLAMLPLNNSQCSIVLTLDASAAGQAMRMPADEFARHIERLYCGRWGRMTLSGERHAYPLVAVYAHRFTAHRFALVGDAAVGMHPVTAHGFNFGLRGADTLVGELRGALRDGGDIGAETILQRYDASHRRATYPLYVATNALVGLYTDNGALAQVARRALITLGDTISPIKSFMLQKLTEIDEAQATG